MAHAGNPGLAHLQPYPFERLRSVVLAASSDPNSRLNFSIGEPKFPTPDFIRQALQSDLVRLAQYPNTLGTVELRKAFTQWLERRYGLTGAGLDPALHVLPNLGSREALFAGINALFDRGNHVRPFVAMPNPGYQIYEGATLLAGGRPLYLHVDPERGFRSDLSALDGSQLDAVQIALFCSPGNPTGSTLSTEDWAEILELADRHDFWVFADECYADIYTDSPPTGLLEAAAQLGRIGFERCLAFHSLSKRSNAPGLRSGFIAGDAALIETLGQYRTYHGSAMSLPVQSASIAAWNDDAHVEENRARYRANFRAAEAALTRIGPEEYQRGAFYLWLPVPDDDVDFCARLLDEENVLVLPGSFMGRNRPDGINPGAGFVRIALIYDEPTCFDALQRVNRLL